MSAAETTSRFTRTRSVPLAWRNLVANKLRLVRSSAGIGFAVLLMLVQLGFERGFFDASLATVRQLDADIVLINKSNYRFAASDPFSRTYLATAATVDGIASVSPLHASWTSIFWKDPAGAQSYLIQAFGFDPDHPAFLLPDVQTESVRLKAEDAVLVDRRGRDFLGMAAGTGDTEINRRAVHIVGSFALGPDFVSDGTVMMSEATFAQVLTGNAQGAAALPVEFGIVKIRPGEDPARVQQSLRATLPGDVRVLTKPELIAFEHDFQADISSAGPIFWMGALVGFVVGMLISYQIIYTDLSDQLPQYATLKGMGYETGYLVRVVIEQAALSALAGYAPAWLACLVVYRVIGGMTLLPLHITWQLTLLSLGLTLGMCLLSAMLAIRRVIAVDPAEVF